MSGNNFTIYKSSAGSGKTFTLVKEYLALALSDAANPPIAYKQILAITFTNKAANEMKERIVLSLKELALDDYTQQSFGAKTLTNLLLQDSKVNTPNSITEGQIRQRAKNILASILHNYSDFAIGTIDSFVHKVVRTFAFDLRIPMSFDLEMDADKLLRTAIDLLIAQIGNNEDLTKCLVAFTESKTEEEKSWHIEKDLLVFAKQLLDDEGTIQVEKLKDLSVSDFFIIKDKLQDGIVSFEKKIKEEALLALQAIANAGIEIVDFFQGKSGIGAYFKKLSDGRLDTIYPNSYVLKAIENDQWYTAKTESETKIAIDSITTVLIKHYNAIQSLKEKEYSNYVLFTLINKNIYSLAVLNELERTLTEYKAENSILHISEFNKLISKIVMNEPIPFIYERLGERYKNYLIDEFQDTSVLQFQNLLPLIDNALASGNFTMLVGDGKQAIYRFRGGEVEQFNNLPNLVMPNANALLLEREQALLRNHNPQVLKKNFRSKREIIEFNNSFFRHIAGALDEKSQSIYQQMEQEFNPENTGGYVQLEFIEGKKLEFNEANVNRSLTIINELVSEKFQLSDIAILVRTNTEGSLIANFLIENNIAVISSDSLLINNSAEVNFLCAWMRFLINPKDEIIQAEIVHYLISKKSKNVMQFQDLLAGKNKWYLHHYLKQEGCTLATKGLMKLPVYELFETLISTFNLTKTSDVYLQFFLDEVLKFVSGKNTGLYEFADYWEDNKTKASLSIPVGTNAINIMTIHRSKGLEFPVVLMPFCNSTVKNGKNFAWLNFENNTEMPIKSAIVNINKNLEATEYKSVYTEETNKSLLDNINLLYVGLTRAEKRLYILSGKPSKQTSGLKNYTDMFVSYLDSLKLWEQTKTLYIFGNKVDNFTKQNTVQQNDLVLEKFNSNNWRKNISIKSSAASVWNLESNQSKINYGLLIHTALSKIKYAKDLPKAVNSLLMEGLITIDEKDNYLQLLDRIISHPQLINYFKEPLIVKNELEIISQSGELHRPDRIVIDGNNVIIMDYKTGSEQLKHKQQVNRYADLLTDMNYNVTEKLLVYIDDTKVVAC